MEGNLRAFESVSGLSRLSDLVGLTRGVMDAMAASKRTEWTSGARAKASELDLSAEDVATPFGDPLAVLDRGPEDAAERQLCAALAAHVLAESPPEEREEEDDTAERLVWLATFTPFDALSLLDRALGEGAGDVWAAIAERVRRITEDARGTRGEALVAAAALGLSSSAEAKKLSASLVKSVSDPAVALVLRQDSAATATTHLEGELSPPPRGPLATATLAFSGILFVLHVARLVGKLALRYQRPTSVTLSEDGVRIESRTLLLGRTLREGSVLIERGGLVRAGREVRYPRIAFYAGLLALAVGSYFGVATLVDGVRAASPSLLATGLLIVALGVALDFVLGSILPTTRGRCRVLFVPQRGPSFCVSAVDIARADAALAILSGSR